MHLPELLYRPSGKAFVGGLRPQFETAYFETTNTVLSIEHAYGGPIPDECWLINSLYVEGLAGATQSIGPIYVSMLPPTLGKMIPLVGNYRVALANPNWAYVWPYQLPGSGTGLIIPTGWTLHITATFTNNVNNNTLNSYFSYWRIPRGNLSP